jgi:hypothetical protein
MIAANRFCRMKKRFSKRLIIECRRCAFKDGCSVLKLYIDCDTALNFKYLEPLEFGGFMGLGEKC